MIIYVFYQSPLILTRADKRGLSHSMCLYQVMEASHFLNDVTNDAESKQIGHSVLFASFKSELTW